MRPQPDPAAPLIVIDLQTGMFDGAAMPPIHDADGLVARVRSLLDWARRGSRKVAFVRHDGSKGEALAPGEPGWAVWAPLGQAAGEPTFGKTVGDAFSNPALAAWVADQKAGGVILAGAQTDECVAATTRGALDRGLKVIVVADAHSTWGYGGETADQIIARYNLSFAEAGAAVVPVAALLARPGLTSTSGLSVEPARR
jgi:nicotinamidase-related amidase